MLLFADATFKGLWAGFFAKTKQKEVCYTLVCLSLLCIYRGKKTKKLLFAKSKFSFLYVVIWFDVIKKRKYQSY